MAQWPPLNTPLYFMHIIRLYKVLLGHWFHAKMPIDQFKVQSLAVAGMQCIEVGYVPRAY